MTGLQIQRELQKAVDAFNEYMMRQVPGRGIIGSELHDEYCADMEQIKREKSGLVREQALKDLINGEKYFKHFRLMSQLLTARNHWEQVAEKAGVSLGQIQLVTEMPHWRKLVKYGPNYDDPEEMEKRKRTESRKIFASARVPQKVFRGGNELYKGLAR